MCRTEQHDRQRGGTPGGDSCGQLRALSTLPGSKEKQKADRRSEDDLRSKSAIGRSLGFFSPHRCGQDKPRARVDSRVGSLYHRLLANAKDVFAESGAWHLSLSNANLWVDLIFLMHSRWKSKCQAPTGRMRPHTERPVQLEGRASRPRAAFAHAPRGLPRRPLARTADRAWGKIAVVFPSHA